MSRIPTILEHDALEDVRRNIHMREAKARLKDPNGLEKQIEVNAGIIRGHIFASLAAIAALVFVAVGLMGYFIEAFSISMLAFFVWAFFKLRGVYRVEADRTESKKDLVARRKKINRKWGRVGAERQKK